MKEEQWKQIENTNYAVSNFGNVKSITRRKLKAQEISSAGYLRVHLFQNGVGKHMSVSRLVAKAFIPNPDPEKNTVVNHLDSNPLNNRADNLEWTTQSENLHYAYKHGRKQPSQQNNQREVWCVDKNNVVVRTFESALEAGKELGISDSTISSACRENPLKRVLAGHTWCFRDYVDNEV